MDPSTEKKSRTARGTKARILLVDDHPLLREGLARRLALEEDLVICGQAGDGAEAIESAQRMRPNLMIVDISLPGRDGIDLLKEIKARYPSLPVLVFSMHDETLYAERALHAGARGYIMKSEPPERLIHGIRRVLAGDIALSPEMVSRLLHRAAGMSASKASTAVELLTDRELEIFRLIGEGHQRRKIAEELHLSVKTVEAHRANIRQKLGLQNAAELLQHAIQFVQREASPTRKDAPRSDS